MTDDYTIQFTFAIDDPELDDDRRLKIASKLLRELQDSPESLKAPEKQERSSVFRALDRG